MKYRTLIVLFLLTVAGRVFGESPYRISGVVHDPGGALVPGAQVTVFHGAERAGSAVSGAEGDFAIDVPAPGAYSVQVKAAGFADFTRPIIVAATAPAPKLDVILHIEAKPETVEVTADALTAETTSTQLGETLQTRKIESVPLNGRAFTDLMAVQPGIVPVSTAQPGAVVMSGVASTPPSGDADAGNLSISGQREDSNGFRVDGADVEEDVNMGTSILPDLDSIESFRVLTSNFDAEYGNSSGGQVLVTTKSGTSQLHGSAFEFLRNTALDARGYFDPTRSTYRQNQFGGTLGGPIRRDRIFFFTDYQRTRTDQGVSTGYISVPTAAQRAGAFSDLTGCVSGPYFAGLLSQELGTTVEANDPYSTASPIASPASPNGCNAGRPTVFGSGNIPQTAWSAPGKALLTYIPSPNVGASQYSTSAFAQTVRDDKASARVDFNGRLGQISGYYFVDDYNLDNPYPGSVAGASIPGFDALYIGRAQLISLSDNKLIGPTGVNEFHIGYLRNANVVGQPKGGLGVSLASQGFSSGANGGPGIDIQAPQFEGVENITFPTFVMGVPITNMTQINDTYYLSDGFTKVIGAHTLKFGGQFHIDQVNDYPNGTFNGTFNIDGTETGDPYADFLLGIASNYTQSSGSPLYLRNRYEGFYGQDSWHARSDLTINAGLRWDIIMPFWEKYGQLQTWVPGGQSTLYPGALPGLLVAGDPGVPKTIAPTGYKNVAPRIGVAWSPRIDRGPLKALFAGGRGSIRASYGIFYTEFPGLAAGIMYGVPPFGYNYLSPAPPLMTTPFITAATGLNNGQRFPFAFPPHNVSKSNPDTSVNWPNFAPLSADPFFDIHARVPYIDNYMLSLQRQLNSRTLLTVSYVGNQGHRILAVASVNLGNPGLCLSLPGCGPFGEDNTYTTASGATIYGTRNLPGDQNTYGSPITTGENYGENTADNSVANSSYNALETTLRYQHSGSQALLSYAYAKSIDQGSNLGEQIDPLDPRQTRAISAWDQRQSFEASYTWALPFAAALHKGNRLTNDWSLSGETRFATGFPVTLYDNSDNSLLGTLGNGVNNYLLDTPQYLPGPLHINTNGRNGKPAFNTALFPEENLGQLGNAKRRMFYGPGIENFDMTLEKDVHIAEAQKLALRFESFNVFNHAQFYGPAAVDGQTEDPNFGQIVSAQSPRLIQLAAKYMF